MRTFTQKRAIQQAASTLSTMPRRNRSGQHREINPVRSTHRAAGNQAVLRSMQGGPVPGSIQPKLKVNAPGDIYEQEADRVAAQVTRMPEPSLQQKCHCGAAGPDGACEECDQKMQREAASTASPGGIAAPASVSDVVRAPGQPLDERTRAFMEPRFGHDFGQVRVHTDERAAWSAQDAGARAYTVGRHIVFDAGQYRPGTVAGQQLLAHELSHVVQQTQGASAGTIQRQERRPRPAPVDEHAQRIIDLAQDTSRPIAERAVAVVQAIINQYYPADASKISQITYREEEQGLDITFAGRGAGATGRIRVGRYFVENTTQRYFARRVAQVRHEIEHVEQQRAGMGGAHRQDEREFIAFYHEAVFQELPGTGRFQHGQRVQVIDAALGYYYCLSTELQQANASRRDELVSRRSEAVRRSGRSDLGEAPAGCRRQPGH